jgi:hypothetical protein
MARFMGRGYIRVTDGFIGTGADALLAPFAFICKVDAGMAMLENRDYPKDMVGACFHAFPAGFAFFSIEFDILCSQVF